MLNKDFFYKIKDPRRKNSPKPASISSMAIVIILYPMYIQCYVRWTIRWFDPCNHTCAGALALLDKQYENVIHLYIILCSATESHESCGNAMWLSYTIYEIAEHDQSPRRTFVTGNLSRRYRVYRHK